MEELESRLGWSGWLVTVLDDTGSLRCNIREWNHKANTLDMDINRLDEKKAISRVAVKFRVAVEYVSVYKKSVPGYGIPHKLVQYM